MTNKNKTVVRSMDILNLFIDHTELSFQEVIEQSGIPKTTAFRMLKSLEEMELLEKGIDAKYRLGILFLKFGHLVSMRQDVRKIAYPIMNALHNDVKEAVNLIVRDGNEAMYIEKVDTKQKVRLYTAIGRKSPLYAGACSRAVLSFLPDDEIKEYLESIELEGFATGTITDKETLYEAIAQARKLGYTISHSELENHTSAIAAPIFDHKGEVIAAMSIAGLEANYQGADVEVFFYKLKKATTEISKQLGYEQ
ncbi:MAG: IclR family transcriptional regulator [Lysinibacillus sp.]